MSLLSAVLSAVAEPARQLGVPGLPQLVLGALVPDRVDGRSAWIADGRAVIAASGLTGGDDTYRKRLEAALEQHPDVEWAAVNAPLGRVVVGLHDESACLPELVEIVARVEAGAVQPGAHDRPPAIGDAVAAGALLELAVDVAGLALSGVARAVGIPAVVAEASAAVSFLDNVPRVRAVLESALGRAGADGVLTVATAAAQVLTQSVVGLVVDVAAGVAALTEARAASAAWRSHEAEYLATPRSAASRTYPAPRRPVPLRQGPVEHWGNQAPAIAAAALAIGVPGQASARPASAIALAAMPKPARLGREGFASQFGRLLAKRGAVTLDPTALRRLDRIGTVILDAEVLTTGGRLLGTVIALPGADATEVAMRLHALFHGDAIGGVHRDGQWALGPVELLSTVGAAGEAEKRRLRAGRPLGVIGLAEGDRLVAVASVVPEPVGALPALIGAVRRSAAHLVVAGAEGGVGAALADSVAPGGPRLAGVVRALQADGGGVLLVSRNRDALAAADVGVGVASPEGVPAWGADVLIGSDLALAATLIEGCEVASRVSVRSVRLSQAALGIAGIAGTIGAPSPVRAVSRAMLAVNSASGVSLLLGAFAAYELGRRPAMPVVSSVPWHAIPEAHVLERLDTTADGLPAAEIERRQRQTGDAGVPRRVGLATAVVEELANPLTPILAAGGAISAAIGAFVDGGLVAGVTVLSALIGGVQRRNTDRALEALLSQSAVTARVLRGGVEAVVPAFELVPGDILMIGPRDVVPADCRVLQAIGLETDESSLTGEPFPVAKTSDPVLADIVAERRSMLYEGTTVAAGRGVAVVVAVGSGTEAGRTAIAAHPGVRSGGVEARLARITSVTLPLTLGAAVAVIASGVLRGRSLASTIGTGVSLAVAAVPEGLPFLVNAAQLAAARRLSTQGALVRNPRTIEALGRVTVLGFDKTGTLTEGKITLSAVSGPDGVPVALDEMTEQHRRVLAAALRATPRRAPGRVEQLTDRAVTEAARDASVARSRDAAGWRQRAVLPFEPSRGYHATVGTSGGGGVLTVKGAPEAVLLRCVETRDSTGIHGLDDAGRRRLERRIGKLASRGYRVLAVAERRHFPQGEFEDEDVSGLALLGLLALSDPIRPAAAAAVARLRGAGVQIVMITGDHPGTAAAIAERLNLGNGRVVTGVELDPLDDDELDELLPSVAVVARSTPAHKVRVVQAFQRIGETVAMTGDGANDAPAIRLADVGIALGGRGTPAARAAADLVVTDDRLETILAALTEGRAMWGSVRKALGILVGGNLGEVAFTVLAAAITGVSPLAARQLLLVNLFTDLAPALAVALRPPAGDSAEALLAEGPEASLGAALTRDVGLRAITTALTTGGAWLAATALGLGSAPTVALTALVGTQLAQTVAAGGFSRGVVLSSLGSAAGLVAVVQTPLFSAFFGSTPLGVIGWGITLAAAGLALVAATYRAPAVVDLHPDDEATEQVPALPQLEIVAVA